MVTVYAYPALFRMRFKLPESYDFMYFWDKKEMPFKVLSNDEGSFVMPEEPFSIADKYQVLQKDGIKRVLVDFSRTRVTKQECKAVVSSMMKGQVISGVSRFNWKDGFYNPEKLEAYKAVQEREMLEKAENSRNAKFSGGKGRKSSRNKQNGFKNKSKKR